MTSQEEASLGHSKLLVLLWAILETAGPSESGVTGALRPSNKSNETMSVVRPGSGSGAQTGLSHSRGFSLQGLKSKWARERPGCVSARRSSSQDAGEDRTQRAQGPSDSSPLWAFLVELLESYLQPHYVLWIQASSIQGVAQSSGSGVPDLSLNLDPAQRGCVTLSSLCYKVKQLC